MNYPIEPLAKEPLAKLRLLTLKALANSSPGLRFGNPGEQRISVLRRNSEGVALRFAGCKAVATPSALNAGGLRHQIKGTWGMTAESVIKS